MQNNTFSTLFVGQNLIKLEAVDSTNNYLKNLASKSEPLAEGTVIMAVHQYQGRGAQNGQWITEPGKNLTFSVFFKPTFLGISQQFLLNMVVCLGVNQALERILGQKAKIKWPNDIYYENRKIVGILIENTLSGDQLKQSVVGIGVNVNQRHFSEQLADKITSVYDILHEEYELHQILADICSAIESAYLRLKAGGIADLKATYLSKLYKLNELATYRSNGEIFEERITDVDDWGRLVIDREGKIEKYNFKEIEFINK